MKKRLLALFLAALMVVSLLPMTAFATGTTYAITNGTPESAKETNHGYITVDETAAEGETVTITVNPATGYQLKSLTATPVAPTISTIADVLATVEGFPKDIIENSSPTAPSDAWTNGTGSAFTYKNLALVLKSSSYMYAQLTTGVTFDATNKCYTATVSTLGTLKFNMTDGVLTSFEYTGKTKHEYDGTYAPASTPSAKLKPITPTKQTDGTYQFTMPGYAVTVSAEFEAIGGTGSGEWFGYCTEDSQFQSSIGTGGGKSLTFAIKIPVASLPNQDVLSKVSFYTNETGTYHVRIYSTDPSAADPGTAAPDYEQEFTVSNSNKWEDVVLTTPYEVDKTKDLWIGIETTDPAYPASFSKEILKTTDCCMMYLQGTWAPMPEWGSFEIQPWMIRGYFESASATYAITNGTPESDKAKNHGYIAIDKASAAKDETVTVTVNPAEGYQLKTLKYNDGTTDYDITTDANTGKYQFTMPAKAVTVTAEFEEKAITIADILPDDFPTFSWPLPDNVWKNSVGSKMYINNNGLTFGGVSLYNILSKPVTKDGNNYKYISSPYTITFVMDSDKLVKVITEGAENADNNGEYIPSHTHAFTYTVNGGKLTATCTAGCDKGYDTTPLTLTLTAPASLVYDGNAKAFTFADGEAAAWTGAGLELPTITYYQKYSGQGWYTQLNEVPANAGGDYMAEIVVNNKAAQVKFTIDKATPYIKTNPEPTDIVYGKKLSDSTLFGGYVQVSSTNTTQVGGLFEWKLGDTIPALSDSETTEYDVTFTPADTNNYNTVSCKVKIKVTHTHNPVKVTGQAATETASGWNDYYKCDCGALFEDENGTTPIENLEAWKAQGGNGYIAPLVHSITPVNGKNATDTEAGYKPYYECKNCNKYYEDATGLIEISNIDEWKAEGGAGYLAPLHGTDNDHDHICDYCDRQVSECKDEDNDHKCDICKCQISEHKGVLVEGTAATLESAGFKSYYKCDCGKFFEDATCKVEITDLAKWKAQGGNGYIAKLEKQTDPTDPKSPETGDNSHMALWLILMALSSMGLCACLVLGKKRKNVQ